MVICPAAIGIKRCGREEAAAAGSVLKTFEKALVSNARFHHWNIGFLQFTV